MTTPQPGAEPAVRYRREPHTAHFRTLALVVAGLVVLAVLPFLVRVELLGYAGMVAFVALPFVVMTSSACPPGLDGTVLRSRTPRGRVLRVDLARLARVDGTQVRLRDRDWDLLTLTDESGSGLTLRGGVGFPVGRTLTSSTAHVVHRQVRQAVASGAVPEVTAGGYDVLGLPRGPVAPERRRPWLLPLSVLSLAVLTGLLLGYVQLLSTVGLAEPL